MPFVAPDVATIVQAMQAQNAITPGGAFETATDKIYVRATGGFDSVEAIRNFTLRANGRVFKIGDIVPVRIVKLEGPDAKRVAEVTFEQEPEAE